MSNNLNEEFEALVAGTLGQDFAELSGLFAEDAPESPQEPFVAPVPVAPAPETPKAEVVPVRSEKTDTWQVGMFVTYRTGSGKVFTGMIDQIAIIKGVPAALVKCADGKVRGMAISRLRVLKES